jgi:hypothetical protein
MQHTRGPDQNVYIFQARARLAIRDKLITVCVEQSLVDHDQVRHWEPTMMNIIKRQQRRCQIADKLQPDMCARVLQP